MWSNVIDEASELRAAGQRFVLATVVAFKSPQSARPGSRAIIRPDGTISGWIGGGCVQPIVVREAKRVLETGHPKLVSISPDESRGDWRGVESYHMTCQGGGSLEIYLEPVLPKTELLIVGNSPMAQILSGIGKLLDFKVIVADPEAAQDRFPEADLIVIDLDQARTLIKHGTYVVVATMGTGDEEGLKAVVASSPRYLGLVASKEKARGLFHYLSQQGITDDQLARVKCPAGMDLGGETLPEIALSVMAEITRLRRTLPEPVSEQGQTKRGVLDVIQEPPSVASDGEARDPVCGMTVSVSGARYKSSLGENTVYFCCLRCKEAFEKSPQQYSV